MLKFIKRLFKEEEKEEEKIGFDEIGSWLDKKIGLAEEKTRNDVKETISSIKDEAKMTFESLNAVEKANLQNPNIPERAKTIMEGNREAFIKRTSFFLDEIDLEYEDFDELIKKCIDLEKELDLLAKSTGRSYAILSQFFSRELSPITESLKNIDRRSKDIRNLIDRNKVFQIKTVKRDFEDIKSKIKLKEKYLEELESEKLKLEEMEKISSEMEIRIKGLKESSEYKEFENILDENEDFEKKLLELEDRLFHDFSTLDRALRKYAKIAFENEELVSSYAEEPVNALVNDEKLEIVKIVQNLKDLAERNSLGLDEKKNEKTIGKLMEMDKEYFENVKNQHTTIKEKLENIKNEIEGNAVRAQLNNYNNDLDDLKNNLENMKNRISKLDYEIEKINIEKLKENLNLEINKVLIEKIIII